MTIAELIEDMPEGMAEIYLQFEDNNFAEEDVIKFVFAQFLAITSASKLRLFQKVLPVLDEPTRDCFNTVVSEANEREKKLKKFVKVSTTSTEEEYDEIKEEKGEKTPKRKYEDIEPSTPVKKPKLEPDEKMLGMDTSGYVTSKNATCKFVREFNTCYVAWSSDTSVVTHHRVGKFGKSDSVCQLPGCGKKFESAEDIIAPIVIVEPIYHKRWNKKSWVCFSHWSNSTFPDEENEDNVINSAAFMHEANELAKKEILTRSKSKASKILFDEAGEGTSKGVTAKKKKASRDTKEHKDDDSIDSIFPEPKSDCHSDVEEVTIAKPSVKSTKKTTKKKPKIRTLTQEVFNKTDSSEDEESKPRRKCRGITARKEHSDESDEHVATKDDEDGGEGNRSDEVGNGSDVKGNKSGGEDGNGNKSDDDIFGFDNK